jgi:UDP-glucose 4-epimerase
VNLGSGSEITINELCRLVAEHAGAPDLAPLHLEPRPGDVRRLLVDSTVMHGLTGFGPRVDFEKGIADLVGWFRTRPQSPEEMLARIEDRNWGGDTAAH